MNDNVLFEIKSIKKSFSGGDPVLKDISLKVCEGEVVSIIGPSGSGKSTLLRCATGLTEYDEGEVVFLGETASKAENGRMHYPSKTMQRKIKTEYGLVFQNFNLFPHYTVLKNIIDAPVSVQKVNKEVATKRALELLKTLGLEGKENAYPCELSGGQQQRVSIARALAMNPKVLFFDEPTSALDPELTGEVLKVIKQLASEHMTMIIVTHEMQFAREVSNRIVFIENGLIVQQGTPDEVFASDNKRVQEFIGKISR